MTSIGDMIADVWEIMYEYQRARPRFHLYNGDTFIGCIYYPCGYRKMLYYTRYNDMVPSDRRYLLGYQVHDTPWNGEGESFVDNDVISCVHDIVTDRMERDVINETALSGCLVIGSQKTLKIHFHVVDILLPGEEFTKFWSEMEAIFQ